jgi:hypothetical protein
MATLTIYSDTEEYRWPSRDKNRHPLMACKKVYTSDNDKKLNSANGNYGAMPNSQ